MKTQTWIVVAFVVSGCAGKEAGSDLPPKPEHGVQIVLPRIEVPAGEERMICSYVTLPSDVDVWVHAFETFQASGGHHVAGFLSEANQPDGTVEDCTDATTMAELRPLLTATVESGVGLPPGFGVKVPAHAKLAFQSHYVNASDAPLSVRDVVNLHFVKEPDPVPVANFASAVLDFEVAPQSETTVTYRCLAPVPLDVFLALGHMHEHGKSISIEAGPAGERKVVYEIGQWSTEYRDTPPVVEWPVDAPLHVEQDEAIDVTCTWQSTVDEPLRFPQEMCAAVLWFFPAEQPLTCAGTRL